MTKGNLLNLKKEIRHVLWEAFSEESKLIIKDFELELMPNSLHGATVDIINKHTGDTLMKVPISKVLSIYVGFVAGCDDAEAYNADNRKTANILRSFADKIENLHAATN